MDTGAKGTFKPGVNNLGLKEGGVDYAMDEHNKALVTDEMKSAAETAKKDIIEGKLVGPRLHGRQQLPGAAEPGRRTGGRPSGASAADPSGPSPSGGMAKAPAIELRAIDKRFGAVHANKAIDLTVERGTIHGIIGENGAGKSTLMSILYGFYEADIGEILIDGAEAVRFARRRTPSPPGSAWSTSISCWWTRSPCSRTSCSVPKSGSTPREGRRPCTRRARCGSSATTTSRSTRTPIVGDLSVGSQQRVEILKALYRGRRDPHPRRADRRPHAGRGRPALRDPQGAEGAGQDGPFHHAQAARDHGHHRPRLGDAPRRDGRHAGDERDEPGRARGAHGGPPRSPAGREDARPSPASLCSPSRTSTVRDDKGVARRRRRQLRRPRRRDRRHRRRRRQWPVGASRGDRRHPQAGRGTDSDRGKRRRHSRSGRDARRSVSPMFPRTA